MAGSPYVWWAGSHPPSEQPFHPNESYVHDFVGGDPYKSIELKGPANVIRKFKDFLDEGYAWRETRMNNLLCAIYTLEISLRPAYQLLGRNPPDFDRLWGIHQSDEFTKHIRKKVKAVFPEVDLEKVDSNTDDEDEMAAIDMFLCFAEEQYLDINAVRFILDILGAQDKICISLGCLTQQKDYVSVVWETPSDEVLQEYPEPCQQAVAWVYNDNEEALHSGLNHWSGIAPLRFLHPGNFESPPPGATGVPPSPPNPPKPSSFSQTPYSGGSGAVPDPASGNQPPSPPASPPQDGCTSSDDSTRDPGATNSPPSTTPLATPPPSSPPPSTCPSTTPPSASPPRLAPTCTAPLSTSAPSMSQKQAPTADPFSTNAKPVTPSPNSTSQTQAPRSLPKAAKKLPPQLKEERQQFDIEKAQFEQWVQQVAKEVDEMTIWIRQKQLQLEAVELSRKQQLEAELLLLLRTIKPVHDAPPAMADLPIEEMADITLEQLITYYPNHVRRWPGLALLIEHSGLSYIDAASIATRPREPSKHPNKNAVKYIDPRKWKLVANSAIKELDPTYDIDEHETRWAPKLTPEELNRVLWTKPLKFSPQDSWIATLAEAGGYLAWHPFPNELFTARVKNALDSSSQCGRPRRLRPGDLHPLVIEAFKLREKTRPKLAVVEVKDVEMTDAPEWSGPQSPGHVQAQSPIHSQAHDHLRTSAHDPTQSQIPLAQIPVQGQAYPKGGYTPHNPNIDDNAPRRQRATESSSSATDDGQQSRPGRPRPAPRYPANPPSPTHLPNGHQQSHRNGRVDHTLWQKFSKIALDQVPVNFADRQQSNTRRRQNQGQSQQGNQQRKQRNGNQNGQQQQNPRQQQRRSDFNSNNNTNGARNHQHQNPNPRHNAQNQNQQRNLQHHNPHHNTQNLPKSKQHHDRRQGNLPHSSRDSRMPQGQNPTFSRNEGREGKKDGSGNGKNRSGGRNGNGNGNGARPAVTPAPARDGIVWDDDEL